MKPSRFRWELWVAARYLRARRKQTMMSVVTLISIGGTAVGVMALLIALSLMSGFQNDIKVKILGSNAQILVFPWADENMKDFEAVVDRVKQVPGVIAAAPVIYQGGMAINERTGSEAAVTVKGIVPDREVLVTDIGNAVIRSDRDEHVPGSELADLAAPPRPGPSPIVLGDELAKELDVLPGDSVRIVSMHVVSGPSGFGSAHPANRIFHVSALFHSGMWDYDNEWAYIGLPVAQEFYRMTDQVTLIEARVGHPDDAEAIGARIKETLGPRFKVQTWQQMNRPFFSALKIEKLLLFLVISLIGVVAALNIATTLTMTVMEKGRDIAILMAMGAKGRAVLRIFRYQGLIIGTVGTILGVVLGIPTCLVLDHYHLIRLSPEVYYITYVPFRIQYLDFTLVAFSAIAVSFLATIYPARHASRLSPCEALRYE
ncbi:MAG: FtsX-like permease family protein [Acidobacteriota bacterium]